MKTNKSPYPNGPGRRLRAFIDLLRRASDQRGRGAKRSQTLPGSRAGKPSRPSEAYGRSPAASREKARARRALESWPFNDPDDCMSERPRYWLDAPHELGDAKKRSGAGSDWRSAFWAMVFVVSLVGIVAALNGY